MRTVVCNYDGSSIKINASMAGGSINLYVDDKLMDNYATIINPIKKTRILKAVNYPFKSGPKTVEVYNKAIFTNKYMICVNGEHIGGDLIWFVSIIKK